MGNCCGGANNEGEISMVPGGASIAPGAYSSGKNMAHIFDEREILGLKGDQKLRLIIKLQALFRGALARKKIKQKHGF
jgi:hypothetical protein